MAPRHHSFKNLSPGKRSSLLKALLTEMPAERAFGTGPSVDRSVAFMANFAKHLAYRSARCPTLHITGAAPVTSDM
jgi:hypothetical protein